MRRSTGTLVLFALGAAVLAAGCAPQKVFLITSHPPGAMVYIDGEKRGQTDASFHIAFHPRRLKTVRLEKEGYQPYGQVLGIEDREHLFVVLQEAPSGREVQQAIKKLESQVELLPPRVAESLKAHP